MSNSRFVLGADGVDRLREVDRGSGAAAVAASDDADARQRVLALVEDRPVLEEVEVLEHHVVAVRDELLPVLAAGIGDRRRDEPEVAALVVGADVEEIAAVVDGVLVLGLARRDHLQLRRRRSRPGGSATSEVVWLLDRDEHVVAAARAVDADAEALVLLLVDERVLRVSVAERVPDRAGTAAWPDPSSRRRASCCRRAQATERDALDLLRAELAGRAGP